MSDELGLDAIEARAEAATPGPWRLWNGWGPTTFGLMAFERLGPPSGERVLVHDEQIDLYATGADAEFIAASRADVPALVVEVRRLRDVLQRVRRVADGWSGGPCLTGYKVSDGDDSDSECLHCAAGVVRRALDGEAADG